MLKFLMIIVVGYFVLLSVLETAKQGASQRYIDLCSQSDTKENCERTLERTLREDRLKRYESEGK
jgi:hypothetical protein